jgi:hypothetical protein
LPSATADDEFFNAEASLEIFAASGAGVLSLQSSDSTS